MTTGINSLLYRSLSKTLQSAVIEQVTLAIRNTFGLIVVGSGPGLIGSLFIGVSMILSKQTAESFTDFNLAPKALPIKANRPIW